LQQKSHDILVEDFTGSKWFREYIKVHI